MSVYKNDNASDFLSAIRSVTIQQSLRPDEVILVADGPISESLKKAIAEFKTEYAQLRFIQLAINQGHAIARQTAINAAQYDWIAIMDSDDIAHADRFEKQIGHISSHSEIDVLGGQITEFSNEPEHIVGKRIVPCTDSEIKEYLKSRCPMNFVTVIIRKEALDSVGGIMDWYCEEDYYLWIRMTLSKHVFANLPDTIVNVRVGNGMYQRRGGRKYFQSEKGIQRFMFQNDIISLPRYCYNVLVRFIVQRLMPNKIRSIIFQKLFRKN